METRLEAMEQQIFKCQGMVECGLNANHMMITEFTNKHKMDSIDIGKHLSRLYDRVDQLQDQIYDLQSQNCEYEYTFKSLREQLPTVDHYADAHEVVAPLELAPPEPDHSIVGPLPSDHADIDGVVQ
ncbi:40s ribosomal protein s5-1 [Hordeum vulgare]|nr:40s ribosomal protein s5-1 [Hordeum vulgare]